MRPSMSVLLIGRFSRFALYDFVNSLSTKRITHSTCSCIGDRCNCACDGVGLLPFSCVPFHYRKEAMETTRSGAASVHRHELCRRVDDDTWLLYLIVFHVVFIFTYVNVGSSAWKSDSDQHKTRPSVPELKYPKNILQKCRAPRRERRRPPLANCEINGSLMLCLCARARRHVDVCARWSTRARLSPLVAARAKCLFNSLMLSASVY